MAIAVGIAMMTKITMAIPRAVVVRIAIVMRVARNAIILILRF